MLGFLVASWRQSESRNSESSGLDRLARELGWIEERIRLAVSQHSLRAAGVGV